MSKRITSLSVIVPTYNGAKWIIGCLESILSQETDSVLEVLVVDDGSTDETISCVKSISDSRIRCISTPINLGVAGARNLGLQEATHDWVAFNDQDDVWCPGRLRRQLNFLDQHSYYFGVVGGAGRLAADGRNQWTGRFFGYRWTPEHRPHLQNTPAYDPRQDGAAYLQTLVCSREIALQAGGFNENLPLADDLDFFMKLAHVTKLCCIDDVVFLYRLGDHNQTAPINAKANQFLGAQAFFKAAMEARAKGMPEPDAKAFMTEFKAAPVDINKFRINQNIRNINTVWVNRGLTAAIMTGLWVLIRNPMAFLTRFFERIIAWRIISRT